MTLKVGVIGAGLIGLEHLDRLAHRIVGSTVSAVFDPVTDRSARAAAAVGAITRDTALDLIAAPDVDAVVIASPGERHAEQVIACIAAGKPVLCEKPLATTPDDAQAVLAVELAAGRRFVQVGFMRRFDRAYLDVKHALTAGVIGEPLLAHAVHRNRSVPATFVGEMALTDSVVHEIDVFRWLFDQEVVAVTVIGVRASPLGPARLRDPQLVILELANGAVVDVESFVNCQYGYDVRCEVVGSLGTITMANPGTLAVSLDGRRSEPVPDDWRQRFDQAYTDELQAWVRSSLAGVVEGPSSWDGYLAVTVAAAAVASYTAGARVQLPVLDRPALYA